MRYNSFGLVRSNAFLTVDWRVISFGWRGKLQQESETESQQYFIATVNLQDETMTENTAEATAAGNDSGSMVTVNLLVAYGVAILAVVGAILYYILKDKFVQKKKSLPEVDDMTTSNTVGLGDVAYLAKVLKPDSSHNDVLLAVASTPENVIYGLRNYKNVEKMRMERIQEDLEETKNAKPKKAATVDAMFNLDDDGWADDDDGDDEKAKAAAVAEEEKKKAREDLKKAVGKEKVKMEGIDDGVLGQLWVEKVLGSKEMWPPKDLGVLNGARFDYDGKMVSALDHPGLRRNLCMITGRLNSLVLNGHPELRK